jgi:hypothetical protein
MFAKITQALIASTQAQTADAEPFIDRPEVTAGIRNAVTALKGVA